MKLRVVGYLDETVEIDDNEWDKAVNSNELESFMDPILRGLKVEVTYGETGEFDGGIDED